MSAPRKYWFKAKASGFGWTIPLTWQGWVVYVALFGSIAYFSIFGKDSTEQALGIWVPTLVSLPIFWWFGEPLSRTRKPDQR